MLQVCDDARAGAVLNDLTARSTTHSTTQTWHALNTLTVNTLAAAEFLLTHAANPDRGNGSLSFVYGAAGYLDTTKPLPVIFALLPVAAWRTIRVACRYNRRRSIYYVCMAGHERHLGVARRLPSRQGDWRWTSRAPMVNEQSSS